MVILLNSPNFYENINSFSRIFKSFFFGIAAHAHKRACATKFNSHVNFAVYLNENELTELSVTSLFENCHFRVKVTQDHTILVTK
jgi:hypothetical protein